VISVQDPENLDLGKIEEENKGTSPSYLTLFKNDSEELIESIFNLHTLSPLNKVNKLLKVNI